VSRWGGIYVPNVQVLSDSAGPVEEPFRVAMVYAAASRIANLAGAGGSEDEEGESPESMPISHARYRAEMREKVLNVLRICHAHDHQELILGAWGCGGNEGPAEEVAEAFHRALLGDSDVSHTFKRVTFAIYDQNPSVFDAFQAKFR
jgi:uncharacterized protein (TIGR02452 family)